MESALRLAGCVVGIQVLVAICLSAPFALSWASTSAAPAAASGSVTS